MTNRYVRDGRAPMLGNVPMNGYKATGAANGSDPQDYVTLAQVTSLIAAISTVPTGLTTPYTISSATAPAGWLFANGQTVSRTTFATLWAAVQAGNNVALEGSKTAGQYGSGDGSTTFTVPNLYADGGYFIRPMASGRTIGSVQADELKSHNHIATIEAGGSHIHEYLDSYIGDPGGLSAGGSSGGNYSTTRNTSAGGTHIHGATVGSTGGVETRPKNIAYPVIIKT